MLPGWGDEQIMLCDLSRLQMAVKAASEQVEADWRQRYRIAGHKVDEPQAEPEGDDAFNDQLRSTLAMFRKSRQTNG